MNKPKVDFIDEPLRYLCNEAFHGVKRLLPSAVRETNKYDRALAFTLGFMSGFGAAEGLEHCVAPYITSATGVTVDQLAGVGLATTAGAGVVPRVIASEYVNNWQKDHPVYSAGVKGVMLGASARALVELLYK